ncbi:30S ribosomal protein S20 [Hydrogenovibrio halophilus]|uniref:30S ribosomal protein S20 n=1 Tax=Hydrogenovibrio halophilus TaxID=373391 RepID=UPI00035C7B9B|nr:30S ribosomal protein S20 [Hydrogenovibrio halophilus]
MANSKQAAKRARQAEKSRQHNASMRAAMRTTIKKVDAAIDSGDKDVATAAFKVAQSSIDNLSNKGLVPKNKAARDKSRLNARVKAMA